MTDSLAHLNSPDSSTPQQESALPQAGTKVTNQEEASPTMSSSTPQLTSASQEEEEHNADKDTPTKASASKKTYVTMAHEAIASLKDRSGSSQVKISKYIQTQYPHLLQTTTLQKFKSRLSLALKGGVKAGRFTKIKASFKINIEWTKQQKAKDRARLKRKLQQDKTRKLKLKELQKLRLLEKQKRLVQEQEALYEKAMDESSDMTSQERSALLKKLEKQKQAREAKERAERLKREIAERLKKRKFPMEDLWLQKEDKELGVRAPNVKKRPALPAVLQCTVAPHQHVTGSATRVEGVEFGNRGLISDTIQAHGLFCGDVNFPAILELPSAVEFNLQNLLFCLKEVLNGNAKKSRMVPPLLSHLFVTALRWLLVSNQDSAMSNDLEKLRHGLGPSSWGEVCFQYMEAMERYYTTDASLDHNVLTGGNVDIHYLMRATNEFSDKERDENVLPSGYGAYLGDARSTLARGHAKLETKDPWNLTAEELMALLRALVDDVLAQRPEISRDIAKRDEEMYELLKQKRAADSQYRKIRLAYEGPRRPARPKSTGEKDKSTEKSLEDVEESKSLDESDDVDDDSKKQNDEKKEEAAPKFKPTASKRQFEMAKKAQVKAQDAYEKGLKRLVSRREPVGYDRNFNAVYFFNHDPDRLYVEVFKASSGNDKIPAVDAVTHIRKSNWHIIETKSLFDQFVQSLDVRGTREHDLYENLMGPVGSSSLRRFLFDDAKERNEKVARKKELEELQRRLVNARIACAAEEEDGGRRSGRLASRAQIEFSQVEHEIETVEKRIKQDEAPKPLDYGDLTGLEALRKFDNAGQGRRETRRSREKQEADEQNALLLPPMPCSKLWCSGNIDGTGIVGLFVAKLLELEEFCESLSPWERENGGRRAWIASLEDIVYAWNSGSPTLLGPPPSKSTSHASDGNVVSAMSSPGTPNGGPKRVASTPLGHSEEKRRKLDSPASSASAVNQSVSQILASLKPLLLELELRVFEITGLAMATRDADEADDNMSVASNEDENDANNEAREHLPWKKKIWSLVSIPTSRYGQIREVLVEAIAAARKAHLSGVVAELRSALLLHHPSAAGECKAAALAVLSRHGGYDEDEDDSGDESDGEEDQNEEHEEEKVASVLSGEAMMINGSLNGDENANRVDWMDAVKGCKTVSRFAALVFAFVKNASELLEKIQGEEESLYDALKVWEKEEERQKRARSAKSASANKKPAKSKFDASTEVWANVRFTNDFCMAKVENFPTWPAKRCEAKDDDLAESLKSVRRVLVSLVGEEGLRVVKTDDIFEYTGKPIEEDLSEYDKDMRSQLDDCLAMARRIVRGRKKHSSTDTDTRGCVEEKKSAI